MSTLSYAAEQKAKTGLRPSRQAIKRAALALATALGVAAATDFGHYYLTSGRYLETTDDAYVKADSTIISPKVSGYISQVLVGDNEKVEAGQLLARIEDCDFRTALDQAHADVAASESAVRNLNAQIELQEPLIQQQAAEVEGLCRGHHTVLMEREGRREDKQCPQRPRLGRALVANGTSVWLSSRSGADRKQ